MMEALSSPGRGPTSRPPRPPAGRVLVLSRPDGDGSLAEALRRQGARVLFQDSPEVAPELLAQLRVDALVVEGSGLEEVRALRRVLGEVPTFLVLEGPPDRDQALEGLRAGVTDLLEAGAGPQALAERIAAASRVRRAARPPSSVGGSHRAAEDHGWLGRSPSFLQATTRLERAGPSEVAVLLLGETGTGKELAARALHRSSPRRDGPFVAVNCLALPETLLESELFGHAQGAFSDARQAREGLFRKADGGTLFLDEVGEMPLPLQGKLLRALEERRVRPVGSDVEHAVDVRLVSATRADLREEVRQGRFREDLYYRLHVLAIELPPLRDRGLDVLLLAHHFLARAAARQSKALEGLGSAATRALLAYPWPGNVRELRNAVEQGVALATGPVVDLHDLPEALRQPGPEVLEHLAAPPPEERLETLEETERRQLVRAMRACRGNKTEAARVLGIDRSTLYRKLARHGL